MDASTSALRRQIEEGFADGVRPTTDLAIATTTENPGFGELMGTRWQEVPVETVVLLRWDLEAFTRRGFRYYLPAFLTVALVDAEVAETLSAYLMSPMGYRDALSPSAKGAVRAVLRHLRDRGDEHAAAALTTYWEDFPVSARELAREQLGRRLVAAFPLDPSGAWASADIGALGWADATALTRVDVAELRDQLPRHLLAVLEGEPTPITWFLSPVRTPDRPRLDALAKNLSPAEAHLIADILAYAGHTAPYDDADEVDAYWRRAPSSAQGRS